MGIRSNIEWKMLGNEDPLWAVASWRGRSKQGPQPWTDEEFYALGASDWADFRAKWQHYGLVPGVAVEIGCGAGRLTRHMAAEFRHVHALDVSEGMLAYARERIDAPNVSFHLVDGTVIPCADGSVDAVFSTHVFQHLDSPADVERYLREIARVLSPGGTMMIHVPVFAWPWGAGKWVRRVYALAKRIEDYKSRRKRDAIERGERVTLMRMRSYPIAWFFDFLPRLGLSDVEVAIFVTKSNNDPHPFVMARKRGSGTPVA